VNVVLSKCKLQLLLRWLWYWAPPLVLMGVIFFLSSQPSLPKAPGPWLDTLLKKLTHVAVYLALFLLLVRAWGRGRIGAQALDASLVTTAAYGFSDEVHQSFVPGRHANWYDVLIDVLVPLLLWLLWRLSHRRLHGARD
jgi:VanZ family protein